MGWVAIVLLCIVGLVFLIVSLVILYYLIRTAVREGIMDAWRTRERVEKEDAVWNPQSGREGFR